MKIDYVFGTIKLIKCNFYALASWRECNFYALDVGENEEEESANFTNIKEALTILNDPNKCVSINMLTHNMGCNMVLYYAPLGFTPNSVVPRSATHWYDWDSGMIQPILSLTKKILDDYGILMILALPNPIFEFVTTVENVGFEFVKSQVVDCKECICEIDGKSVSVLAARRRDGRLEHRLH